MRRARIALLPGENVLIGRPGTTMPADWWLGTIQWCGTSEVLVNQSGIGGAYPHMQVFDISYIRAVGTIAELGEIKRQCVAETEVLANAVRHAEVELTAARQNVYRRLDELAAAAPLKHQGAGI